MKHVTKHFFVLGVTLAGLVMGGSVAPVALKAQEVEPPNTHPYGKAWEERRPSEYAKPVTTDASEDGPAVLAPTAFANEHRMVFESYRDGQYEIYAADGDGGGAVRLTTSGSSRFPKLRYGAITVAYTFGAAGSRDLRSVRKDGSEAKQLLSGQGYRDVAWSPDGTKLAYALRTATTDVYVANYDFAANAIISETCLTCGSGRNNFEPSWSPDGKQIVFVKASATEPKGALWLMNADGTDTRQLSSEQWWIADVRWSPDGAQVAFDYAPSREAWQRLGALTLATGAIRQVYNPNQDRVDAWMGSWSPDSQMLFFTRVEFVEQGGQLYIGKTWIERVNANGSGRARLAGNSGLDAMPSVQRRDLIAPVSFVKRMPEYGFTPQRPEAVVSDLGGSEINNSTAIAAEIRARIGETGDWVDSTFATTAQPGQKIYFRSIARDNEGNIEPPPTNPDYDTYTTIISAIIDGRVTDVRGTALSRPIISGMPSLAPIIWNDPGNYRTFTLSNIVSFDTDPGQKLRVQANGYEANPDLPITIPRFVIQGGNVLTWSHVLRTPTNLLMNSDFESLTLDGWQLIRGDINQINIGFQGYADPSLNSHSGKGKLSFGFGISNHYEIAQSVTIPITMHKPTLSFFYRSFVSSANNDPSVSQSITMTIQESLTKELVYHVVETRRSNWKYIWADMSRWLGKQITTTIEAQSPGSIFPSAIIVDEVALTSWLTPVPTQTSLTQLPANAPATQLTITGTNFIATPTVKLNGSIALGNVQWLTETQLIADLPANLPLGIYDLWVTNPGGQESVLQNAIRVGQQLYLPLARKDE